MWDPFFNLFCNTALRLVEIWAIHEDRYGCFLLATFLAFGLTLAMIVAFR